MGHVTVARTEASGAVRTAAGWPPRAAAPGSGPDGSGLAAPGSGPDGRVGRPVSRSPDGRSGLSGSHVQAKVMAAGATPSPQSWQPSVLGALGALGLKRFPGT